MLYWDTHIHTQSFERTFKTCSGSQVWFSCSVSKSGVRQTATSCNTEVAKFTVSVGIDTFETDDLNLFRYIRRPDLCTRIVHPHPICQT